MNIRKTLTASAAALTLAATIAATATPAEAKYGRNAAFFGGLAVGALALGALVHAFGWQADDYDRLAAGSLVGHLLECSGQSVGGNLSGDWSTVPSPWDLPYPIAEVTPDATAIITKPQGTSGIVCIG